MKVNENMLEIFEGFSHEIETVILNNKNILKQDVNNRRSLFMWVNTN